MEIELKYALEKAEQYTALLQYLQEHSGQEAKVLQQENFFFDTVEGDLRKSGLILRLRKENSAYWLTAKGSAPQDETGQSTLTKRLEEESQVASEEAQKALQGDLCLLEMFEKMAWPLSKQRQKDRLVMIAALQKAQQKKNIVFVGSFKNIRRVFEVSIAQNPYKIECDETHFPGNQVDYEMEIELQHSDAALDVSSQAEQWLTHLRIPITSARGKASRFFASLALNPAD